MLCAMLLVPCKREITRYSKGYAVVHCMPSTCGHASLRPWWHSLQICGAQKHCDTTAYLSLHIRCICDACRALLAETLTSFGVGWQQNQGYTHKLLQRLLADLEAAVKVDQIASGSGKQAAGTAAQVASGSSSQQSGMAGKLSGSTGEETGVALNLSGGPNAKETGTAPSVTTGTINKQTGMGPSAASGNRTKGSKEKQTGVSAKVAGGAAGKGGGSGSASGSEELVCLRLARNILAIGAGAGEVALRQMDGEHKSLKLFVIAVHD